MTGNEKILQYLSAVPAWYLATSVDDQPHVRPFSFAAEQDGKIWFCTATTKDVWDELVANPKFEATAWWPGHGWLILRGRAGLEDKVNDDIRYRLRAFERAWRDLRRAERPHAHVLQRGGTAGLDLQP